MSAWDNYDNWLLKGSGVDDNTPEIFETEKYKLFSVDENIVAEFDELVKKAEKDSSIYLNGISDDLEEYIEYLQDELGLHSDEYGVMEELDENAYDAKIEKAEYQRQLRKDEGI